MLHQGIIQGRAPENIPEPASGKAIQPLFPKDFLPMLCKEVIRGGKPFRKFPGIILGAFPAPVLRRRDVLHVVLFGGEASDVPRGGNGIAHPLLQHQRPAHMRTGPFRFVDLRQTIYRRRFGGHDGFHIDQHRNGSLGNDILMVKVRSAQKADHAAQAPRIAIVFPDVLLPQGPFRCDFPGISIGAPVKHRGCRQPGGKTVFPQPVHQFPPDKIHRHAPGLVEKILPRTQSQLEHRPAFVVRIRKIPLQGTDDDLLFRYSKHRGDLRNIFLKIFQKRHAVFPVCFQQQKKFPGQHRVRIDQQLYPLLIKPCKEPLSPLRYRNCPPVRYILCIFKVPGTGQKGVFRTEGQFARHQAHQFGLGGRGNDLREPFHVRGKPLQQIGHKRGQTDCPHGL